MKIHRLSADEKRRQAELRRQERAVIDEYGELSRAMAPHKASLARLTALAKSIRERFQNEDPLRDIEAAGDFYFVTLGPAGLQTRIEDMQATYDALGHERFLAHCSMTLEKLKAATAEQPGQFAALTLQERTGSRPLLVSGQDQLEMAA